MMYSLLWTRSELPSHHFYDYDGDFICTDSWIAYWTHSLVAKKNCNSRISLPHSSISFISTWDTRSIIYCKCVYFLPFSCPVFINLIFVILYHFSPRNYIDENRRCIDYYHADYSYTKIRRKFCALHHLICDRKRRLNQLCVRLLRKK